MSFKKSAVSLRMSHVGLEWRVCYSKTRLVVPRGVARLRDCQKPELSRTVGQSLAIRSQRFKTERAAEEKCALECVGFVFRVKD